MSARAVYNSLINSKLYFLEYNGTTLGVRAELFNVATRRVNYYDFSLNTLKNDGAKRFLTSIKSKMSKKQIIKHGELLLTREEIDHNIVITECKSDTEIVRVLAPFVEIYR